MGADCYRTAAGLLLGLSLTLFGCTGARTTGPLPEPLPPVGGTATQEPGSPTDSTAQEPQLPPVIEPKSVSTNGPYLFLLGSSTEQIQMKIGKAEQTAQTEDPRVTRWLYPSLGLEITLWDANGVFWYVQTKGWVTGELQVGDSAEKVTRMHHSPADLPGGDRVVRIDTDRFSIEFHLRDHRLVYALILPPDTDI